MKILVIGDLHGKIVPALRKEISKAEFDFIIGIGDYTGIDDWHPYIKYIFSLKKSYLENKIKRKSPKEFYGKKKFKNLLEKDFNAGKYVLKFLDNIGKPGFFVFGNGDEEWYDYPFSEDILQAKRRNLIFLKKIKNIKEMTYKVEKYNGIFFLGFGGYVDATANNSLRDKEWQKRVDIRNKKAEKKIDSLVKKIGDKSIFILHYPPLGIFDKILLSLYDKKGKFKGKSVGVDFFRKSILKKKPFLVLCGHMHEYQGSKKLGSSLVINPGEGARGKFAIVDIDENKGKVRSVKFYGKNKK
jgi:Icc-related predicted phosphoesterase